MEHYFEVGCSVACASTGDAAICRESGRTWQAREEPQQQIKSVLASPACESFIIA